MLVWLFALVSSWANACQLQSRVPVAGPANAGVEHVLSGHASGLPVHDHAAQDEGLDHESGGARPLCQAVCDDEQSSLPKVDAPSLPDLGPAALVPIESWSFRAARAQASIGRPLAAAPPPELTVAIRFLRLTN